MFRFAFVALALIAFGAVLASGAGGVGLFVLAPLFILGKIFLVLLFFGVIGGFFWRSGPERPSRSPWNRRWQAPRGQEPTEKSRSEQFEEWHRLAHARDEVDTWTEGLD